MPADLVSDAADRRGERRSGTIRESLKSLPVALFTVFSAGLSARQWGIFEYGLKTAEIYRGERNARASGRTLAPSPLESAKNMRVLNARTLRESRVARWYTRDDTRRYNARGK